MLAYQYLDLNLVKMPFALEDRLAEYRKRVEELFEGDGVSFVHGP